MAPHIYFKILMMKVNMMQLRSI